MAGDISCNECGYYRGHPNRADSNGLVTIFICSHCQKGDDTSIERAEQRLGA